LIIEISQKTLLTTQLLCSAEISLKDISIGTKKEFDVFLTSINKETFGSITFTVESFNFGKENKTEPERIPQKEEPEIDQETVSLMGPNEKIIKDRYLLLTLLGKGGMGEVYEVVDTEKKEKLALKRVFCNTIDELNHSLNECLLTKSLDHPNLVKYLDMYIEHKTKKKVLCIVMELLLNGDLLHYLKMRNIKNSNLSESELIHYMKQILNGLVYFHSKDLIHRDLKPENFFLTSWNLKYF
jgi:serine/threonine protein kinase